MKALTVKQPWAYLICKGIKDIENRTWKCPEKYTGKRILIHAGSQIDKKLLTDEQMEYVNNWLYEHKIRLLKGIVEWERGAIIGSVVIKDCTINHPSIWAEKTDGGIVGNRFFKRVGETTTWNWMLEDAILFDKPILNVKGKLSFWESGYEILVCPKCGNTCLHDNTGIDVIGWGNPVCLCPKCGYYILESEFEFL